MMKQEDFENAVQKIYARPQLKEKVLSGKPSEFSTRLGYFRYATYAATALLFVVCFLFLAKTINTAVPTNLPTSQPAASQQTSAPNGLHSDNKVQNILLISVDRNPTSAGWIDCIMVLTIDSRGENQRLVLAPFTSELYVDIPGHGKNKLNASYTFGGAALAEETIEKNFKLDIDYYAETDLTGLKKTVDRMGGIRVELSEQEAKLINDFSGVTNKPLKAGSSVLTGKQALYYSRIRPIDNDLPRLEREQNVAAGIINRFKEMDSATQKEMILDVLPLIKTNMDKNLIMNASVYCNYPVSYLLLGDDLFQKKQVTVQGSTVNVLVPDLDKYSALLYRSIYQNNVS
jgi:LCP family protein required for cell wall assembly